MRLLTPKLAACRPKGTAADYGMNEVVALDRMTVKVVPSPIRPDLSRHLSQVGEQPMPRLRHEVDMNW